LRKYRDTTFVLLEVDCDWWRKNGGSKWKRLSTTHSQPLQHVVANGMVLEELFHFSFDAENVFVFGEQT